MAALLNTESLGRPFVNALLYWRGFFSLLRHVVSHLDVLTLAPVRSVLLKQIYFTGIQALGAISMIAVIAGVIITVETISLVGTANPTVISRVLLWMLVRELGPLLAAIVVIARSGAAIASELAVMRVRGELSSLRHLGIDPLDYLIAPRVAGGTLSALAVTFYFQAIALVSGLGFASFVQNFSFLRGTESVVELINLSDVLVSLLKAFVFGLVISITSCLYGLRVQPTVTDVPRAVTRAVLQNVLALFLLDAVITYLFFI